MSDKKLLSFHIPQEEKTKLEFLVESGAYKTIDSAITESIKNLDSPTDIKTILSQNTEILSMLKELRTYMRKQRDEPVISLDKSVRQVIRKQLKTMLKVVGQESVAIEEPGRTSPKTRPVSQKRLSMSYKRFEYIMDRFKRNSDRKLMVDDLVRKHPEYWEQYLKRFKGLKGVPKSE